MYYTLGQGFLVPVSVPSVLPVRSLGSSRSLVVGLLVVGFFLGFGGIFLDELVIVSVWLTLG